MSDTATQDIDVEPTEGENANLKLLREKAKKADEAEAALAASRREVAVLKSGIDVDSPLGAFFVETYSGDPTDVEALKAKANELGVPFKGEPEPTTTETPDEPIEPTGTTERQMLSDGSPADSGVDEDPRKVARDHYDKRMSEGAPQENAAGEALNILANAAMRGDKRVVVE